MRRSLNQAAASARKGSQVKPNRYCSLIAVLAVGATALLGSSSALASDTALCEELSPTLECPAESLTAKFHLVATNTEVLLPVGTSSMTLTCAEALIEGTLLALGSPQVGHLTDFTFAGCETKDGQECAFSVVLLGQVLLLETEPDVASMQFHNTSLRYECGVYIDCVYGVLPTSQVSSASLPTHAGLVDTKVTLAQDIDHSGLFCPNTVVWKALYEFLEDVYVRS
jgi:hypothetical protein